jgi:hypothetical protein
MAKLVGPDGAAIIGTLETVRGVAGIEAGSVRRAADGGIAFDYAGETDIWWDEQKTVLRDGERVFVDENYNAHRESELRLIEDGEGA